MEVLSVFDLNFKQVSYSDVLTSAGVKNHTMAMRFSIPKDHSTTTLVKMRCNKQGRIFKGAAVPKRLGSAAVVCSVTVSRKSARKNTRRTRWKVL